MDLHGAAFLDGAHTAPCKLHSGMRLHAALCGSMRLYAASLEESPYLKRWLPFSSMRLHTAACGSIRLHAALCGAMRLYAVSYISRPNLKSLHMAPVVFKVETVAPCCSTQLHAAPVVFEIETVTPCGPMLLHTSLSLI